MGWVDRARPDSIADAPVVAQIATFTGYYFRSHPAYDDEHIRMMFCGDANRKGLLHACGQISWKSFRMKTSSIKSLDLLADLLDEAKNRHAAAYIRVLLSLDDASFKAIRLDKSLAVKETRPKATIILNLLQAHGRQIPLGDSTDDAAESGGGLPTHGQKSSLGSGVPGMNLGVGGKQLAPHLTHRASVMMPPSATSKLVPAPQSKSNLASLITKLGNLLSRRPNISALVEKGIVQAPKAFGRPLAEVVARGNVNRVPTFLVRCCDFLRENAMDKVGVFRVSGEQSVRDTCVRDRT